MLDSLDDRIFAELADAYGPAVDVPARLRALAGPDLEDARAALEELGAGIFHQGSYSSATAPAVPFLLELAGAEVPARADVLLFLADMSGATTELELAYQPYLFRSTPGLPDYPEAAATIEAIASGREVFVAALDADSASVRACAACLVADVEPLVRALERETDPHARISLHFALARLGQPAMASETGLVADVVDVLSFGRDRERALAATGRLLMLERPIERERMPFFDGDLVRFAALALVEHGREEPRAFEVAERALAERLNRGETIRELPRPPSTRIRDPEDALGTGSFAELFADLPLRSIAGAMASLAFGERAGDPRLLVRDQLDERMRRVLELTRDHAIPVPVAGAPWIERSSMARFLTGGGPLDELVEWRGESRPLFAILIELTRGLAESAEAQLEVEHLFAELAGRWSPERLTALAIDILDNGYELARYGQPLPAIRAALANHVDALARECGAQLSAYAERLLERERVTGAQAQFALASSISAGQPVEPRFDRLARLAIAADKHTGRAWLERFPEPRRSRMVAAYGSAYLHSLFADLCDPATLEAELIAGFLDPACEWFQHEAESLLATVADTARLQAMHAEARGRRRAVLGRVIQARTRAGVFVLELLVDHGAIQATLYDGIGTLIRAAVLSTSPRVDELVPMVEACAAARAAGHDPTLELTGDIDSTTNYRVTRLLGDAGFRGRVIAGSSTVGH